MAIDVTTMLPTEKVFTWQDPDTLEELNFAVDRLNAWCVAAEVETVLTPVEVEFADLFIRERGIEFHRVERMTFKDLLHPVIYCCMPKGTHLLVDGHHRYVFSAMIGQTEQRAHILTQEQWEPFLISGMPTFVRENIISGFSGIL
jgi:hypothetical protein